MYIDAHCHVDRYPHPGEILRAAERARVVTIAVTETPSDFQALAVKAGTRAMLRVALGLHPLRAGTVSRLELSLFRRMLSRTDYVGEVGLDFSPQGRPTRARQLEVFEQILAEPDLCHKVLTVHSRGAERDTVRLLIDARANAILHWYTGAIKHLDAALSAGMWFSVNAAMLTSKNGQRILAALPRERVVTESDGPYAKHNGRQSTPSTIPALIGALAALWNEDPEATRERVFNNMKQIHAVITSQNGAETATMTQTLFESAKSIKTASADTKVASNGRRQKFRFVLPRLYTLAPEVMGGVFHSQLSAHPIEVRVPDSPRHQMRPVGGETPGTGVEWIVPRWLELAGPATLDLEGPAIHTELKAWWRRTTDWLAAWLGTPSGVDIPLERLALPLDEDPSDETKPRGVMQFYGFDGETRATSDEFALALEFAGANAELPTAYILLVRAESAYDRRDMRLAVIEACGAAEVAATVAIERALTNQYGCPIDFVTAVARGARGIRRAHETVDQLGVATGADKAAVKELADLRNTAVHAGRAVAEDSVGRALVIARGMVTTLVGRATPAESI